MMRKTSDLWYHFSSSEPGKGKCQYCSFVMSCTGGSTGNLIRHLKRKHPTVPLHRTPTPAETSDSRSPQDEGPQQDPAAKEATVVCEDISSASTSRSKQARQSHMSSYVNIIKPVSIEKNKQLDNQLVRLIAREYHPFSLVEDAEFRRFVQMLCPGYQIPSRKTLTNSLIPILHQTTVMKVKATLDVATAVCLTADGWTSVNNNSFLAITAHFLDEETNMCSKLLGCVEFNEKHTAANLADKLHETAREWKIDYKIVGIVTDNAANIVLAVQLLKWRHIPCYAHTLNLIVQTSIKVIKSEIEKVKSIVQYFKHSAHALAKLHSVQKQMQLPELKLKQDVGTRWNSTLDMLLRFLHNKEPILSTLAVLQLQDEFRVSAHEWEIIENATKMLAVFEEVTKEISPEKNVSLSKTCILSRIMVKEVQKCLEAPDLPAEVHALGTELIRNLRKRFQGWENNELISQATLLDPRFKRQGFSDDQKFKIAYEGLLGKVRGFNFMSASTTVDSNKTVTTSISKIWEEFDKKIKELTAESNPTAASTIELDKYIAEPMLPRTGDPLHWWNDRKALYPRLYTVVKKRLCVVATSVPCERIFSKAGQILSEKRSRMKSSKLSMILFLNANLE